MARYQRSDTSRHPFRRWDKRSGGLARLRSVTFQGSDIGSVRNGAGLHHMRVQRRSGSAADASPDPEMPAARSAYRPS